MKPSGALHRIILLLTALLLIAPGIAQAQDSSLTPTPVPVQIRYDDPVLRWLPEMTSASAVSGVPVALLAAVMRVESVGDPNIISPAGARGLMQIMPVELAGQGLREESWHDPATNITAGAWELVERLNGYGSWDGAVGAYFGFGCDVFGTCTDVYVAVVFKWMDFYAWALGDPGAAGLWLLPSDWVPPAIAPYMEAAPPAVETPEPSPTPEPTATEIPPAATSTPEPAPTEVPTDIPAPTEAPTDVPAPTEIVVEEPTEVVVEEPTDVVVEEPTEAPVESAPVEEPTDAVSDAAA
jgi:hypothetical protein